MAGTITTSTIQNDTSSPPTFRNNSVEIGTLCRAWVNFNGTGTVAIRASFNVSSITDNGTGDYTVNFTTALPNINYSAVVSTSQNGTLGGIVGQPFSTTVGGNLTQAPTTTTTRIVLVQPNVGPVDSTYVCVTIFSS